MGQVETARWSSRRGDGHDGDVGLVVAVTEVGRASRAAAFRGRGRGGGLAACWSVARRLHTAAACEAIVDRRGQGSCACATKDCSC